MEATSEGDEPALERLSACGGPLVGGLLPRRWARLLVRKAAVVPAAVLAQGKREGSVSEVE